MDNTNLFSWATKELSQDAFICWLMSFALKENHGKNPALEACALDVIHQIPELEKVSEISNIEKQVYNIDVLLTVEDYYIIIEDKTFTDMYQGQISGYKQNLVNSLGIDPEKIICVLYKISGQSHNEQNIDYEFTREKLLQLMCQYKEKINNDVFNYYIEYLEALEKISLLYTTQPISEWDGLTYQGFFKALKDEGLLHNFGGYGYVPNPSGGFWGLWWNFCSDIDAAGKLIDSVYLQLENNIIAVKICADPIDYYDREKLKEVRQKIYDYFVSCVSGFKKKRWRLGNYMTVGYVEYNEKNYREQIAKIQKVFDDMNKELRLS